MVAIVFIGSLSTYAICKRTGYTKRLECSKIVQGTVISRSKFMDNVGGQTMTATYTIDGKEYTARGGSNWLDDYYEVGESVPVHYNPYKVSEAYIGAPAQYAYGRSSVVFVIASALVFLSTGMRGMIRKSYS